MTKIKSSKLRYYLRYHIIDLFFIGAVTLKCYDLPSGSLGYLLCGLLSHIQVDIYDGNIRSCFCKCCSCTLTYTSGSSGYKTFFTIQTHLLYNTHLTSLLKNYLILYSYFFILICKIVYNIAFAY